MKSLKLFPPVLAIIAVAGSTATADDLSVKHSIVAVQPGRFHGWPANNGVWHWGDEILVGFTQGDFVVRSGHNIAGREDSLLARSLDGGRTWKMFDPEGFLDDENQQFQGGGKSSLKQSIDFLQPGFALRVYGVGYHGAGDPDGGFFYSDDRGRSWNGPFAFTGLADDAEMRDKTLTPRTDYLVQDKSSCFLFITAYGASNDGARIACIQTTDGGRTFDFVAWVTPRSDSAREIMSQTVQLSDHDFVLASRKIYAQGNKRDTIETHRSTDRCRTWRSQGAVKVMQASSNPPALVKLKDGRLCCAYGDRSAAEIRARYSEDQGATWGPEIVIRDDYQTMADDPDYKSGFSDMGYVRLVQRPDGKLVAIYYWATSDNPQQHIAASIWSP